MPETDLLYWRQTCLTGKRPVVLETDLFWKTDLSYWRQHSKTSFEKNCFSAWASTLNMGLINKVDMVCLSHVGYGV